MSIRAYYAVSSDKFSQEDMVQSYADLIEQVLDDANRSVYQRPKGGLQHPPAQGAGVDIFPVTLFHEEKGIGRFPTQFRDYREFKGQIQQIKVPEQSRLASLVEPDRPHYSSALERLKDVRVIVAAPVWTYNGVNLFSQNLVRELCNHDISAHILFTEEETNLVNIDDPRMPRPSDVPFEDLPVKCTDSWGGHWGTMIRYLEERAPCIYLPNYDWRHSCIAPLLSDRVLTVGIAHGDTPLYVDHVQRLGRYWNAIVAVDNTLAQKIGAVEISLNSRLFVIPHGVNLPDSLPERVFLPEQPLKLVCLGAFEPDEGEMLEGLVCALKQKGIPFALSVIGIDGSPGERMEHLAAAANPNPVYFPEPLPQNEVLDLFGQHDVILLVALFRRAREALLEAMGRGCVPVLVGGAEMQTLAYGIVRDGHNGYVVDSNDLNNLVDCLAGLQGDLERHRQMSVHAHDMVVDGTYHTVDMAADYLEVFDQILYEAAAGKFQRPEGILRPPPAEVAGINVFPMELSHTEDGIGHFPTRDPDYMEYQEQIHSLQPSRPTG